MTAKPCDLSALRRTLQQLTRRHLATATSHLLQAYRGKTSVLVVNLHLGGVQLRLLGDAWSP